MIQAQKILEKDGSSDVTFNSLDPSTWRGPSKTKNVTTQNLHKVLRQHSDCRITKEFNKYGITSAATEQNLANAKRIRPDRLKESFMGPATITNHEIKFKSFKNCQMEDMLQQEYANPLRLCGGAPSQDNGKTPASINANRFDKIISAYQKAIDPRRQPSMENDAPPYIVRLFDGSDDSLDGAPCGARRCPSARLASRPDKSLLGQTQSQRSCGLAGCPRIKSKSHDGDDTEEKIAEFEALARSATKIKSGSKCPSSMLPPIPPLQTIHWDCPDPLPKGSCENPLCPLKPRQCRDIPTPKGSCGTVKCPYSVPVICGDECPMNPPEILPYTPPPPLPCPQPPPCAPPPCYLPPPCFTPPPCPPLPCYSPPPCPPPPCYPPPPCPPPPCYPPPPCPKPPCYLPHPCHPPPPPCHPPYPCYPPPPPTCRNPKCPHSPPPCPPKPLTCPNPRCPHSPPPCPPKIPTCPNPRCPHSPPPCPPKSPTCPIRRCS